MFSSPSKLLIGFLLFFFLFSFNICSSEEEHSYPVASYQIDVKLDTLEKELWGNEMLTFVNTSTRNVDTLFLHLYPNAFQSESTTLMKESLFPDRIKKKAEYRGFMRIEKVGMREGIDLTDQKIIDETIMKLPLPNSLNPQERIELKIEFVVKLPQIFVRMGYDREAYMLGQWFPKMAVLEDDGNWNAHQYHFNSEFFADFGRYDVSITVPPGYVIAATGFQVEERENSDSTKTFVFLAEDVHDFAWAASPNYRISKRITDNIEVSFFYKPEHEEAAKRIMDEAEFALKYYSSSFGRYPYDHFTIVDAKIGLAGGAMEYPTLITISPSRLPPEKVRADALILFHEIAHQWWYGLVASNEFEEAWLDEGFAVYSERRALEKRFGKKGNIIDMWGIKISDLDHARFSNLIDLASDPVVKNSWEFRNYSSYLSKVYFKASLVLETLRNHLGEEIMDKVLKEYFRRYEFKHPKTQDFIRVVKEVSGEDFTPFLEQFLFGTVFCDYGVTSIESLPFEDEDKEEKYRTRVELERIGEVAIPLEVEIELEDGEKIRRIWDGKERWHKIEMTTDTKVKSARVDPDDKIALDINLNNNSLTTGSNDSVLMKLSAQCLFWLEILIHLLTCF
jgi:hypothetical protein